MISLRFAHAFRGTLVLLATALTACGGDDAPAASTEEAPAGGYATFTGAAPGGTLVVLEEREPDSLNPLTFDSHPAFQAVHLMFRSLARRDSTLSGYQPDLAESWEVRPDSTVVLHLRRDVQWHDGQPVTAEDVVFTIERMKDPAVASPRALDVEAVQSVSAPDRFTVEAKLDRVGPSTVNALLEVVPVPEHLLGDVPPAELRFAPFGRDPVGNGFFRFGGWQASQQLTLIANEQMPEGRPPLDRVVIRFVPDRNAALTELLAGQGDLFIKLPSDQRSQVEAAQNVEVRHAPRVRPAWIAWNADRFPVDDPRVRRAILMATNRDAIVRAMFGEEGEVASSPIPSGLREHSSDVRPIPFDPAGARRLLAQAGWRDSNGDGILEKNGRPLRVEVDYNSTDPVRQDVLVAMQSMLREVGVELVPRAFESTAWVTRLRERNFQGSFWGWGWGPGVVGPNAERVFHTRSIPPGGPNFAGYSNPRVDALIDSVLVETDTARARGLWRKIEQQTIDDAVYAPIYLDPEFFGVNSRFRNVKFRGIEWWEDVPYWSVPPEQRLPRDRAGAGGS